MESLILQLSDIHLKGDQKGMFDVQGNLDAVLADAGKQYNHYNLIVLTGDLVDDATVEDYTNLFEGLQRVFGADLPKEFQPAILVTPGNHDNRAALEEAFTIFRKKFSYLYDRNAHFEFRFDGSFNVPGQAIAFAKGKNSDARLCLLDTAHKDYPVEGLFRLLAMPDIGEQPMIAFTHMPLVRPFHRFMNQEQFTLPVNFGFVRVLMKSAKVTTVCCGHYHHANTKICYRTGLIQYTAPAIQMQIDPYTKDFNASGKYPGYNIVHCASTGALVETRFQNHKEDPKDEA